MFKLTLRRLFLGGALSLSLLFTFPAMAVVIDFEGPPFGFISLDVGDTYTQNFIEFEVKQFDSVLLFVPISNASGALTGRELGLVDTNTAPPQVIDITSTNGSKFRIDSYDFVNLGSNDHTVKLEDNLSNMNLFIPASGNDVGMNHLTGFASFASSYTLTFTSALPPNGGSVARIDNINITFEPVSVPMTNIGQSIFGLLLLSLLMLGGCYWLLKKQRA